MTVRRVVTGHGASGKAITVSDGETPNVFRPPQRPGTVINTLWAVDQMPAKLDDSETLLRAGDTVIQCDTNHAWSNRSDQPCRMAFVMLGAEPPARR